jgi:hypothetical protein
MSSKRSLEEVAVAINSLDRDAIKRRIKNFKGRFKLDFTDKYLDTLSIDRLRHILLAAFLTNSKSQRN